jgi:DNA polymerase III subunit delta'
MGNMADNSNLNWQIKGHVPQLKLLENAMSGGKLAHAYIFSGPSQVGKRSIARKLAQFLLCQHDSACQDCVNCKTFSAGSNADYLEINADDAIKIDAIRDLTYKLALKPYAGKYKVAVINDAHNLTQEAANALLKVLEEPKDQTLMVLVTDNFHRLLPTISSRAQKLNFGPVDEQVFAEWLQANGYPQPDPAFAGKPGHVLQMANAPEALEQDDENSLALRKFLGGSMGEKLLLASELAERETLGLKNLMDHWLHHLRMRLKSEPTPEVAKKITGVLRAQKLLDQNVNSKLLLSELMLNTNSRQEAGQPTG